MKDKKAFFNGFISVSTNKEGVAKLICDCFCKDLRVESFEECVGENDLASDLFMYNCAFLIDGYMNENGIIDVDAFKSALAVLDNAMLKEEAWELNVAYTTKATDTNGTDLIVEVGQMFTHNENENIQSTKSEIMYKEMHYATFWNRHELMGENIEDMIQAEVENRFRSFDFNTQADDLCKGMGISKEQLLELYPLLERY